MSQYLDLEGVKALWEKVKAKATSATAAAKNYTDQEITKITDGTYTAKKATSATSADSATNVTKNINGKAITNIFETDGVTVKKATSATNATNVTTSINGKAITDIFETNGTTVKKATSANSAANATHANSADTATTASVASKASKDGDGNIISSTYVKSSLLGKARGVATLDETGQVPASQLPSFVDDVIEGYLYNGKFYKESAHTTAITGEGGKIYVDLGNKKTYRWSGSAFVEISASIAIGETTGTAFDGKRGKDLENAYSSLNTNLSKKLNITGTSDPDTSGYITKVDFTREGLGGSQFNGVIHSVTTNNKNADPKASIVESHVEVGMSGVVIYCSEYIGGDTYGFKVTSEGVKNFYDDGSEYDVIDASMAIPVSVITALA
jgi:hypothetical protein